MSVSPEDLLNDLIGGSEKRMRAVFDIAVSKSVESGQPTILFFDEIDGILGKTNHHDSKAEKHIIKIFQMCMEGARTCEGDVLVLAATNYRDDIPPAILSRFDKKISIELPAVEDLVQMMKLHIRKRQARTSLTESQWRNLAEKMKLEGASGRDVKHLMKKVVEIVKIQTEECQFWCRDEDGYYVPCSHDEPHMCGKERMSVDEVKSEARLPPLSFGHFEEAIAVYGISSNGQS